MSVEDFREGFRNGTLAFCMPAAHAEFCSEFLDGFSERILKQDWRDVLASADCMISAYEGRRIRVMPMRARFGLSRRIGRCAGAGPDRTMPPTRTTHVRGPSTTFASAAAGCMGPR